MKVGCQILQINEKQRNSLLTDYCRGMLGILFKLSIEEAWKKQQQKYPTSW